MGKVRPDMQLMKDLMSRTAHDRVGLAEMEVQTATDSFCFLKNPNLVIENQLGLDLFETQMSCHWMSEYVLLNDIERFVSAST